MPDMGVGGRIVFWKKGTIEGIVFDENGQTTWFNRTPALRELP
jgi:hypothetical protein